MPASEAARVGPRTGAAAAVNRSRLASTAPRRGVVTAIAPRMYGGARTATVSTVNGPTRRLPTTGPAGHLGTSASTADSVAEGGRPSPPRYPAVIPRYRSANLRCPGSRGPRGGTAAP